MSRYILLPILLILVSVIFTCCTTLNPGPIAPKEELKGKIPEAKVIKVAEKLKAVEVETVEEIDKTDPADTTGAEAPEKASSDVTAGEWIIPRDTKLPAKFYSQLADVFLQHRQRDMGLELLDEAISRENNNELKSAYYAKLGQIRNVSGLYEPAIEAYEKAAEITKSEEKKKSYYKILGKLYGQVQDYDKGISTYQYLLKQLKEDEGKIAVKRQLYMIYLKAGRMNELTAPLEAKLKEEPDNVEVLEELVFIHSNIIRKPRNNIPYLKKLGELFPSPENRKYLNRLLRIYRDNKMLNEQTELLVLLMKDSPKRQQGEYLFSLARVYTDAGKREKAIESVEQALAIAPENIGTHTRALAIIKQNGDDKKAEEMFNNCLMLAKNDPEKQFVYLQYGRAHIKSEEYEKADELFQKQDDLVEDKKLNNVIYMNISRDFNTAGESELAMKWMQKTIDANPSNPMSYIDISSILFADGKIKEAREIIKQGFEPLADTEDKAQLYLKYFSYSIELKDYKGAREVLPKIRKLTKDNRILNWTRQQEKKLDRLEGKSGK